MELNTEDCNSERVFDGASCSEFVINDRDCRNRMTIDSQQPPILAPSIYDTSLMLNCSPKSWNFYYNTGECNSYSYNNNNNNNNNNHHGNSENDRSNSNQNKNNSISSNNQNCCENIAGSSKERNSTNLIDFSVLDASLPPANGDRSTMIDAHLDFLADGGGGGGGGGGVTEQSLKTVVTDFDYENHTNEKLTYIDLNDARYVASRRQQPSSQNIEAFGSIDRMLVEQMNEQQQDRQEKALFRETMDTLAQIIDDDLPTITEHNLVDPDLPKSDQFIQFAFSAVGTGTTSFADEVPKNTKTSKVVAKRSTTKCTRTAASRIVGRQPKRRTKQQQQQVNKSLTTSNTGNSIPPMFHQQPTVTNSNGNSIATTMHQQQTMTNSKYIPSLGLGWLVFYPDNRANLETLNQTSSTSQCRPQPPPPQYPSSDSRRQYQLSQQTPFVVDDRPQRPIPTSNFVERTNRNALLNSLTYRDQCQQQPPFHRSNQPYPSMMSNGSSRLTRVDDLAFTDTSAVSIAAHSSTNCYDNGSSSKAYGEIDSGAMMSVASPVNATFNEIWNFTTDCRHHNDTAPRHDRIASNQNHADNPESMLVKNRPQLDNNDDLHAATRLAAYYDYDGIDLLPGFSLPVAPVTSLAAKLGNFSQSSPPAVDRAPVNETPLAKEVCSFDNTSVRVDYPPPSSGGTGIGSHIVCLVDKPDDVQSREPAVSLTDSTTNASVSVSYSSNTAKTSSTLINDVARMTPPQTLDEQRSVNNSINNNGQTSCLYEYYNAVGSMLSVETSRIMPPQPSSIVSEKSLAAVIAIDTLTDRSSSSSSVPPRDESNNNDNDLSSNCVGATTMAVTDDKTVNGLNVIGFEATTAITEVCVMKSPSSQIIVESEQECLNSNNSLRGKRSDNNSGGNDGNDSSVLLTASSSASATVLPTEEGPNDRCPSSSDKSAPVECHDNVDVHDYESSSHDDSNNLTHSSKAMVEISVDHLSEEIETVGAVVANDAEKSPVSDILPVVVSSILPDDDNTADKRDNNAESDSRVNVASDNNNSVDDGDSNVVDDRNNRNNDRNTSRENPCSRNNSGDDVCNRSVGCNSTDHGNIFSDPAKNNGSRSSSRSSTSSSSSSSDSDSSSSSNSSISSNDSIVGKNISDRKNDDNGCNNSAEADDISSPHVKMLKKHERDREQFDGTGGFSCSSIEQETDNKETDNEQQSWRHKEDNSTSLSEQFDGDRCRKKRSRKTDETTERCEKVVRKKAKKADVNSDEAGTTKAGTETTDINYKIKFTDNVSFFSSVAWNRYYMRYGRRNQQKRDRRRKRRKQQLTQRTIIVTRSSQLQKLKTNRSSSWSNNNDDMLAPPLLDEYATERKNIALSPARSCNNLRADTTETGLFVSTVSSIRDVQRDQMSDLNATTTAPTFHENRRSSTVSLSTSQQSRTSQTLQRSYSATQVSGVNARDNEKSEKPHDRRHRDRKLATLRYYSDSDERPVRFRNVHDQCVNYRDYSSEPCVNVFRKATALNERNYSTASYRQAVRDVSRGYDFGEKILSGSNSSNRCVVEASSSCIACVSRNSVTDLADLTNRDRDVSLSVVSPSSSCFVVVSAQQQQERQQERRQEQQREHRQSTRREFSCVSSVDGAVCATESPLNLSPFQSSLPSTTTTTTKLTRSLPSLLSPLPLQRDCDSPVVMFTYDRSPRTKQPIWSPPSTTIINNYREDRDDRDDHEHNDTKLLVDSLTTNDDKDDKDDNADENRVAATKLNDDTATCLPPKKSIYWKKIMKNRRVPTVNIDQNCNRDHLHCDLGKLTADNQPMEIDEDETRVTDVNDTCSKNSSVEAATNDEAEKDDGETGGAKEVVEAVKSTANRRSDSESSRESDESSENSDNESTTNERSEELSIQTTSLAVVANDDKSPLQVQPSPAVSTACSSVSFTTSISTNGEDTYLRADRDNTTATSTVTDRATDAAEDHDNDEDSVQEQTVRTRRKRRSSDCSSVIGNGSSSSSPNNQSSFLTLNNLIRVKAAEFNKYLNLDEICDNLHDRHVEFLSCRMDKIRCQAMSKVLRRERFRLKQLIVLMLDIVNVLILYVNWEDDRVRRWLRFVERNRQQSNGGNAIDSGSSRTANTFVTTTRTQQQPDGSSRKKRRGNNETTDQQKTRVWQDEMKKREQRKQRGDNIMPPPPSVETTTYSSVSSTTARTAAAAKVDATDRIRLRARYMPGENAPLFPTYKIDDDIPLSTRNRDFDEQIIIAVNRLLNTLKEKSVRVPFVSSSSERAIFRSMSLEHENVFPVRSILRPIKVYIRNYLRTCIYANSSTIPGGSSDGGTVETQPSGYNEDEDSRFSSTTTVSSKYKQSTTSDDRRLICWRKEFEKFYYTTNYLLIINYKFRLYRLHCKMLTALLSRKEKKNTNRDKTGFDLLPSNLCWRKTNQPKYRYVFPSILKEAQHSDDLKTQQRPNRQSTADEQNEQQHDVIQQPDQNDDCLSEQRTTRLRLIDRIRTRSRSSTSSNPGAAGQTHIEVIVNRAKTFMDQLKNTALQDEYDHCRVGEHTYREFMHRLIESDKFDIIDTIRENNLTDYSAADSPSTVTNIDSADRVDSVEAAVIKQPVVVIEKLKNDAENTVRRKSTSSSSVDVPQPVADNLGSMTVVDAPNVEETGQNVVDCSMERVGYEANLLGSCATDHQSTNLPNDSLLSNTPADRETGKEASHHMSDDNEDEDDDDDDDNDIDDDDDADEDHQSNYRDKATSPMTVYYAKIQELEDCLNHRMSLLKILKDLKPDTTSSVDCIKEPEANKLSSGNSIKINDEYTNLEKLLLRSFYFGLSTARQLEILNTIHDRKYLFHGLERIYRESLNSKFPSTLLL